MASDTLSSTTSPGAVRISSNSRSADRGAAGNVIHLVLRTAASLRLTVVLFAMAIFIVLAGTLAQIDKDIWQVVHEYFRTGIAWIDFQIFFPRSMHVPGGFFFPGGWLIGLAMAINLVAAHAVRFKIQSKGARLLAGLGVIALGAALVGAIVVNGDQMDGASHKPLIEYGVLWKIYKTLLAAVWLTTLYALLSTLREKKAQWWLLLAGVWRSPP